MKRSTTRFLLVMLMVLSLCFLCVACGGDAGNAESVKSSTTRPQDDPNEGLGDRLPSRNESTGNVIGLCEGIWLGTKGNDYDGIEFDAEGEWLPYTGGGRLYIDEDGDVLESGYVLTYLGLSIDG